MDTTVEHVDASVPLAVVSLSGELDARNYLELVDVARQLVSEGTDHVLLDLTELTYLGSSGLVALHSVSALMEGREPPDPEHGWSALHEAGQEMEAGSTSRRVKLLNPQPQVSRVLERTGLASFYETHTDRDGAVASF